ncbi:MAG: hypothetical protein PUI76_07015 [Mollicutes bacterium]|nr:hypothetical protein [Mollicutes bacterium]
MNKKPSLLLLSSLLLLAGCAGGNPSSSETKPNPSASDSATSVSSSSSASTSSTVELTAEERFKANFEAYKKNTIANEPLATSASYQEGENVFSASFFKNQVVQHNPGNITLVRSIEGNSFLEFRFEGDELVDFAKTEMSDATKKEFQQKTSLLLVNNAYGLSANLGVLDDFAKGAEGKTYEYENDVFTLTEKVTEEGATVEKKFEATILDEAIVKLVTTTSTFASEADSTPASTSSSSYEWKKEGAKVENPEAVLEENYCFKDIQATLVSEDGRYLVGNSYAVKFASTKNPKASTLVDAIISTIGEDNEYVQYNARTNQFKILKAGEVDIPFVSAHGVSGSLHIVTEDKPINGIRLNQEDKEVVAGSSVSLSATILPMTAKNLYTAEITSGSEFATLTGNAADGYTLQVKEDAAAGSKIVVTFTSIQSKADGSKAVASNTFTVKAKSTEGATLNLKGTWEDDGYPASTIVFKEDKTGTVVYYDSMMTAYYYKFTWNNATADSLADEGSFVELDDEEGNEVDWGSFTLSSFKLVDSQVVLQFDGEDPKTFTKTFSVSDLGGGITY